MEKITVFKEKKAFIDALNLVFQVKPRKHSVQSVAYEVYSKAITNEFVTNHTYYQEFLVVTFDGGSISVRNVNGNSCTANLREVSKLVDGGYYDEVEFYKSLEACGFMQVEL